MRRRKWLLLDGLALCYRALHSTGMLSYHDVKTGIAFGIFRDIITFQDFHETDRLVFCFDYGRSIRERYLPTYKETRKKVRAAMSTKDRDIHNAFLDQVDLIRKRYLKEVGFRNVFWWKGYEADDIIASLALHSLRDDEEAIIVSGDHDFYQLLSKRVSCWNPITKKTTTLASFQQEWGVTPKDWIDVKAIAGCGTDDVCGIDGVGEPGAAKFLRGELPKHHKKYKKIVEQEHIWKANRRLVRLPFEGCPEWDLVDDELTESSWISLAKELGFSSLASRSLLNPKTVLSSIKMERSRR